MRTSTKTSGFRFPESKGEQYETMMLNKYNDLIHKVIHNYEYLMPYDDLYQCGCIGLLYAIRWWDESKNVPFMKTAALCIKSHVMSEYRRNEMIIRNDAGVRNGAGYDDGVDLHNFDCEDCDIYPDVEETDEFMEWLDSQLTDEEIDTLVLNGREWSERYPDKDLRWARRLLKKKITAVVEGTQTEN